MTATSNKTLGQLDEIITKSKNISQIISWCRKLETEEEKNESWESMRLKWYALHNLPTDDAKIEDETITTEIEKKIETKDPLFECLTSQQDLLNKFKHLNCLRSLWWVYNRTKIDIVELEKEKIRLTVENKEYRDIIKGILEDALLEPAPPKVPVVSVRPVVSSAPASLGSCKWAMQVPPCVDILF